MICLWGAEGMRPIQVVSMREPMHSHLKNISWSIERFVLSFGVSLMRSNTLGPASSRRMGPSLCD